MSPDLLAGLPDLGRSAKRVARQGETVMALHQTVQHGVGDGGVSVDADRKLTHL